jgi:hypothetical protein
MAQKIVCDFCGQDITEKDKKAFDFRKRPIMLTACTLGKSDWEQADICIHCLIDAGASRDDRPQQSSNMEDERRLKWLDADYERLEDVRGHINNSGDSVREAIDYLSMHGLTPHQKAVRECSIAEEKMGGGK